MGSGSGHAAASRDVELTTPDGVRLAARSSCPSYRVRPKRPVDSDLLATLGAC